MLHNLSSEKMGSLEWVSFQGKNRTEVHVCGRESYNAEDCYFSATFLLQTKLASVSFTYSWLQNLPI